VNKPHKPQLQIARTAIANCTNWDSKPHEQQPQIARTWTANRTYRNRKLHELRSQTARNRDRKSHEPRPNRSVKEALSTTMHLFTFYLESDGMSTNNDYKHFFGALSLQFS
jgi:hypothetical protein